MRSGRARDLVLGGSYPMPDKPDVPGMIAVQKWIEQWAVISGGSLDAGAPASSPASAPDNSQDAGNSSKPPSVPAKNSGGGTSTPASPELSASQTNILHEITNLGICLDTHDESMAFKKLKRFKDWNSIILVTSALHMQRAKALFEHTGIKVRPMAADFEVYGVPQDLPFSIFPRMHRLHLWGLYLHEKIGMIAYRNKGWI